MPKYHTRFTVIIRSVHVFVIGERDIWICHRVGWSDHERDIVSYQYCFMKVFFFFFDNKIKEAIDLKNYCICPDKTDDMCDLIAVAMYFTNHFCTCVIVIFIFRFGCRTFDFLIDVCARSRQKAMLCQGNNDHRLNDS